jgi:hypothetical protein
MEAETAAFGYSRKRFFFVQLRAAKKKTFWLTHTCAIVR